MVGHITPEAFVGGLIGLLKDDDQITIDADKNVINADLTDEKSDLGLTRTKIQTWSVSEVC